MDFDERTEMENNTHSRTYRLKVPVPLDVKLTAPRSGIKTPLWFVRWVDREGLLTYKKWTQLPESFKHSVA